MAAEDEALKTFYENERVLEKEERKLMKQEDEDMSYMVRWERWEREITDECAEARKIAAAAAPAKLNTQLKQAEIKDKAKAYVDEVEVKRKKEASEWDGKGKKPATLNRLAKFKLKRTTLARLKKEFWKMKKIKQKMKLGKMEKERGTINSR